MWRTTESYVFGDDLALWHHQYFAYDSIGQLTSTHAQLQGTLALDRFHESAGASIAPAPANASSDALILVGSSGYDSFGNETSEQGANNRCRAVSFDSAYAQFATSETVYAGSLGVGGCGSTALTASATYDRGLEAVVRVTDLHGEIAEVAYDGFGRLVSLTKPDPNSVGSLSGVPSVKIDYSLPDVTGKPYSVIHTQVQDGADASTDSYRNAYGFVDGLGRTIVTLDQADPGAGDAGDYIANGLTLYDAKGAARRAYRPWFYSGDPLSFPLSMTPPSKYGSQRYDAFGRQLETFGLDGTITLRSAYHALSSDAWDAADVLPGPHQGTFASTRTDGHGRTVSVTERVHAGTGIEAHDTQTAYFPGGEVLSITRVRGTDSVTRWFAYDSLGRRVLNVEPDTTAGFNPSPSTDPSTMHAWRYAYDDAGDLVGTSDARGCGVNFAYDAAGRLVTEDYSPCLDSQLPYSAPALSPSVTGIEVLYHYDTADSDSSSVTAQDSTFVIDSSLLLGRLVSVSDRGAKTITRYDGRGRVLGVARRMAKPGDPSELLSDRYDAHWFIQGADYDGADRVVAQSTGADVSDLMGSDGKSAVTTTYTKRGAVKTVAGSYGTLVASVTHDADALPLQITYGDIAATKSEYDYDDRRRLRNVITYRGPPSIWVDDPPVYAPPPGYTSGTPATFQLVLENTDFTYDVVDNPIGLKDWRIANEWPAGAKPVSRIAEYDDLYRVSNVQFQYEGGDDTWVSPFDAENNELSDDPKLATPSPHQSFAKRVLSQSFTYDWLGNTTHTADDANGFYDRSLGAITNGTATSGPYQLRAAGMSGPPNVPHLGQLTADYDAAGNLTSLAVQRNGPCLPSGAACGQRFVYDWDEVGRLVRARRWDLADPGAASDATPSDPADADLAYAYDANDMRVRKSATNDADTVHSLYPLPTLEVQRTTYSSGPGGGYVLSAESEVAYLAAGSVTVGRLAYESTDVPTTVGEGRLHVFLTLADYLGSTSTVVDLASSEVVERTTYTPYGGTESDYRPARWEWSRETRRFTGKEEDVEVGLQYFGARFYSAALGRWVSADPLAVHGAAADANVYAYVRGQSLRAIDPVGLDWSSFWGDVLDGHPVDAVANQWNKSVLKEELTSIGPAVSEQWQESRLHWWSQDPSSRTVPTLGKTAEEVLTGASPGSSESGNTSTTSKPGGPGCSCTTTPAKAPEPSESSKSPQSTASSVPAIKKPGPYKGLPSGGPGKYIEAGESMSEGAEKYQLEKTGTPPGHAYEVDGVKFDGWSGDELIEAKGTGYAKSVEQNGKFKLGQVNNKSA